MGSDITKVVVEMLVFDASKEGMPYSPREIKSWAQVCDAAEKSKDKTIKYNSQEANPAAAKEFLEAVASAMNQPKNKNTFIKQAIDEFNDRLKKIDDKKGADLAAAVFVNGENLEGILAVLEKNEGANLHRQIKFKFKFETENTEKEAALPAASRRRAGSSFSSRPSASERAVMKRTRNSSSSRDSHGSAAGVSTSTSHNSIPGSASNSSLSDTDRLQEGLPVGGPDIMEEPQYVSPTGNDQGPAVTNETQSSGWGCFNCFGTKAKREARTQVEMKPAEDRQIPKHK